LCILEGGILIKIRKAATRSSMVALIALVCVVGGESVASLVPIELGCCFTRHCYDESGNLISTKKKCIAPCLHGWECVTDGGCDENNNAWVSVECEQQPA